jgi:hypothetical protein
MQRAEWPIVVPHYPFVDHLEFQDWKYTEVVPRYFEELHVSY